MMAGGCQCGRVRYEVTGRPRDVFVCHCRECRKQSASAFGVSIDVAAGELRLVRGTPREWTRPTPRGRLICHFCADCGSRLWHAPDPPSGRLTVKGGSLDEPPDLSRAVHIWTTRKLDGIVVPDGASQFPEEPPDGET